MNEPKNTVGIVTAATTAAAEAPNKPTPSAAMSKLLSNGAVKDLLAKTLADNAGTFTASLIDLYGTDTYLQNCQPKAVMQEALKAVSLKLPINKQLGFAYIVPRKSHGEWTPVFQIGYKGLIQLAMRIGIYKHINADVVYEGEQVSYNRITGEATIAGEATSGNAIGFFAYIETVNGFSKCLYWTKAQVIEHANRYSDSYKAGNKIWKDNFDEMAIKTVLSNLLKRYALLSVDMVIADAVAADSKGDSVEEETIPVDVTTGEVMAEGGAENGV